MSLLANLNRRERMIVLVALAVLVIVGGWELVIQPLRDRNQQAAELIPMREQTLARRLDLIGRRQAIESDLQATEARIATISERFLTSAAPAVAASELQKIAKDMASEARTEIRSERILPPVERGALLEIPVEIAVSGEIRQLVDLLAKLEAAEKLLTVQDLRVRVVNVTQPRELLATLTLSGFILPAKART